jgi:hypothetical protein
MIYLLIPMQKQLLLLFSFPPLILQSLQPSYNQSILPYLFSLTFQNRNKSWKPECVLSFNMDWRILVNFIPCFWLGIKYYYPPIGTGSFRPESRSPPESFRPYSRSPRIVSPSFINSALKNEIWKIPLQIFVFWML